MSLPNNVLSSTAIQSALVPPDDRERENLLEDFERGGVALNDPSQGLNLRDWRVFTNKERTEIWVAPYPENTPQTLVHTGTNITEVSLAFDQNMQPTIAYVENGVVKLRWYDTQIANMTVTSYATAQGAMVTLDDKREVATRNGSNDVIFAYIRSGMAYYRQQRDRYGVEYPLGPAPGVDARIVQLGMGVNGRLQFKLKPTPTARYADLTTDTLYVLSGTEILPVASGVIPKAVWRSRIYEFDEQPSPGWCRVEGAYPVKVRVYGDGEMVYETPDITSEYPVRLPAARYREWALEVVGTNRVVRVTVANDRAELV